MANRDWFDDIGLSYCKNFDEVEAARDDFEEQRRVVLERLHQVAQRAFSDFKPKVTFPRLEHDAWRDVYVKGFWTKIRRKSGNKGDGQSGVYFAIDRDPCFAIQGRNRFGFVAGIYFSMARNQYNEIKPSLTEVAKDHHCEVDHWGGRGEQSACIRSAWVAPEDRKKFRLAAFEAEIRRLPGLFKKIDRAVDEAYEAYTRNLS